jgi:major membrane immunogen (membrane-anchored lipoprotein)
MVILVLLVLSQAAWAQNQAKNQTEKVASLEELQTRMKVEQADLLGKNVNFDKAGSNVTNLQVTENNITYRVTVYQDKNGHILREFRSPDGKLARSMTISPGNGPVLTITYNPDGTTAKLETFEPFGLKKFTEINNSDGTKTEVVQDASLATDNTLTIKVDANGNVISKDISTTPGLPPGAVYCQNTGQYQEAKAP